MSFFSLLRNFALIGPLLFASPAVAGPNFVRLGAADGDSCLGMRFGALSSDGKSAAYSEICSSAGYRGVLFPDFLSPGAMPSGEVRNAVLVSLSADGQTAVGQRELLDGGASTGNFEGIVLRASGELIGIGEMPNAVPGEYGSAGANGISPDGGVVVGAGFLPCGDFVPIVWTEAEGIRELTPSGAPLEEGGCSNAGGANDASLAGEFIVGSTAGSAFIWSAAEGVRTIGDGVGSAAWAQNAKAISSDGSTVVGSGRFDGVYRPFVWSNETGLTPLSDGPGGTGQLGRSGEAYGVSADGSVVVGGGFGPFYTGLDQAFIWTPAAGLQNLRRHLESIGVQTSGWQELVSALAISDDGSAIIGIGLREDNAQEELFYALLAESQRGVNLCAVSDPGCVPVEVIARSGQAAFSQYAYHDPVHRSFGKAVINNAGEVAFSTSLGSASEPGVGGFAHLYGPGPQGWPRICSASSIALNDDVLLEESGSLLYNTGGFYSPAVAGVWRCDPVLDLATPVFVLEDALSDPPSDTVAEVNRRFQVDSLGRISFFGNNFQDRIVGPNPAGEGYAALLSRGDIREGPAGEVSFLFARYHARSSSGLTAMLGRFTFEGPFAEWSYALWTEGEAGELVPIVKYRDPVPGYPEGTTFGPFSHLRGAASINSGGDIVASTSILPPDQALGGDSSLWRFRADSDKELLVTETDRLPGLPEGVSIQYLRSPLLNDRGDVLVSTRLEASPAQSGSLPDPADGFWLRTRGGRFTPLLRSGQAAPGLPSNIMLGASTYDESDNYLPDADVGFTPNGRSLFDFRLEGPGVDASNDRALYTVARNGAPSLVLRRGDQIETAVGQVRTIDDYRVWFGFWSSVGRSPVNSRGDVVAVLDFTDGTEAVVKIPVPEPASAVSLLFGSSGLLALAFLRVRRWNASRA